MNPSEHVPEPQLRARRLSDGLVQGKLGDPRLNFDRFLPTWFFAPSNSPRATYKALGARSDPAYHRLSSSSRHVPFCDLCSSTTVVG